ncbi:MAG TPA: DUF2505 domain-containing protein [Ilumatobacteraceae bacterium]|jgi:hypothetical protein
MQFTAHHSYKHSAGELLAMMTDFETVKAKYEALGHSNVQLVECTERDDGSVVLVTRRVVPLELPGFAKKVLSPKQQVLQTDAWAAPDAKGVRTGTFTVEAKGTPVRVHGTLRLAPKGRGCTNVTKVTVECKLPFIGGKIADLVAKDTRRAVDHEQVWMSEQLDAA